MSPTAVDQKAAQLAVEGEPALSSASFFATLPFAGKVALITGAGRGIGRGIALELAQRGCSIIANYASSSTLAESLVNEIHELGTGAKAVALRADVSKPDEIFQLFAAGLAHFGQLDFVISNAGTEVWQDELKVTEEEFDRIFDINCRGQFFVAQQGMKYLPRGGRIILMSSIAASVSHVPNHALYAGSKAAVEGFTRCFSIDCGPKGITCNAIAPGGIKTDMFTGNAWHYTPGANENTPMSEVDAGIARASPLNRLGYPADVGRAVALLLSPESEWINGKRLHFGHLSGETCRTAANIIPGQVIRLSGGSL
jgi:3-oxoacyl-[acyl-carrier protein] reductase